MANSLYSSDTLKANKFIVDASNCFSKRSNKNNKKSQGKFTCIYSGINCPNQEAEETKEINKI